MEETLKQNQSINPTCIKVVLYGPESTGKSTLAAALADHFDTVFVEEFSRSYAQQLLEEGNELSRKDVLKIAEGQIDLENRKLAYANKVLICDTDLLETRVYSECYYDGYCPEEVKKYAQENIYDLYFLTYIDTPWEPDGIRDLPDSRTEMFKAFEHALIESKKPYVLVKGSYKERLELCINQIENLLNHRH